MRTHTSTILAALSLALGACGGMATPARNMAVAPAAGANEPYGPDQYDLTTPEGKRAEIARRFQEISQWRRQTGHTPEPTQSDIESLSVDPSRTGQNGNAAGRSLTCVDICKIQDSICDNAESICRLADDLDGDEWASQKCQSSKASCEDARDNCTQCTPANPKKDSDSRTKIPPTL